jgi:ankyrin repeat protein
MQALVEDHLAKEASPNTRNRSNRTLLMVAAQRGRAEICRLLLRYGADPSLVDDQNWTAMHHACAQGQADALSVLTARPFEVPGGVLLLAARSGGSRCVSLLLDASCDPASADEQQQTAAHIAAAGGHTDVLKMLPVAVITMSQVCLCCRESRVSAEQLDKYQLSQPSHALLKHAGN